MEFYNFLETLFKDFLKTGKDLLIEKAPPQLSSWTPANMSHDTTYFHPRVMEDIKKHMNRAWIYEYIYDSVDVDLTIVDYHENKSTWESLLVIINLLIYILNRLSMKKYSRKMKLTLYMSQLKKILPRDGSALTPEHVNTGVTISNGGGQGEVIVYREEEMVKVLIHELIHFYDFDQKHLPASLEEDLNRHFKIAGKSITVNESFTDILAVLLNTMIYTIIEGKHRLRKNFEVETQHIINQAAKVLKFINLNRTPEYREQTHVISYYVLKAIAFRRIDIFMNFLKKYNFHLTDPKAYIDLLKESLFTVLEFEESRIDSDTLKMTSLDILNLMKHKTI